MNSTTPVNNFLKFKKTKTTKIELYGKKKIGKLIGYN
jgi:hypothetical protein